MPEHNGRGFQQRIWHNMDDDVKNAFARTFKAHRVYSMDEWIKLFENYIAKLNRGECDNEISPEKYISSYSGEYTDIRCDICNNKRNILTAEHEKMMMNKTIVYCDDCAYQAEDWKKPNNTVRKKCDGCKCDIKVTTFWYFSKQKHGEKIYCDKCKKLNDKL